MKIIESNCQTGKVTEREMTPEEVAEVMARQDSNEIVQDSDAEASPIPEQS